MSQNVHLFERLSKNLLTIFRAQHRYECLTPEGYTHLTFRWTLGTSAAPLKTSWWSRWKKIVNELSKWITEPHFRYPPRTTTKPRRNGRRLSGVISFATALQRAVRQLMPLLLLLRCYGNWQPTDQLTGYLGTRPQRYRCVGQAVSSAPPLDRRCSERRTLANPRRAGVFRRAPTSSAGRC